jgi:hypothetical protein
MRSDRAYVHERTYQLRAHVEPAREPALVPDVDEKPPVRAAAVRAARAAARAARVEQALPMISVAAPERDVVGHVRAAFVDVGWDEERVAADPAGHRGE